MDEPAYNGGGAISGTIKNLSASGALVQETRVANGGMRPQCANNLAFF